MSSVLSTRVLLARLVSGSLLTEATDTEATDTGAEAPPSVGTPPSPTHRVLRTAAARGSSTRVATTKLPPGVAQAVRRSEPARRARL